jgi:hypothetical protein
MTMPLIALLTLLTALVGAVSGGLAARWVLSRREQAETVTSVEPSDPFISAELDRAAVKYATEQGRPEAAGLVADKLHLLHHLGQRRGWR